MFGYSAKVFLGVAALAAFVAPVDGSGMHGFAKIADVTIVKGVKDGTECKEGSETWRNEYAASELAGYLKKMSGVKVAVIDASRTPKTRNVIVVGNPVQNPLTKKLVAKGIVKLRIPACNGDGFAVASGQLNGRRYLVMGGENGVSTLYSVYDYLERRCNCGFFMDGDHVPTAKSIPIDGVNYTEKPRFKYRDFQMWYCYGLKKYWGRFKTVDEMNEWTSWLAKRKLNMMPYIFQAYPEWGGLASVRAFDYKCKPEEAYYAGWPGYTWDFDPAVKTKWLQDWFKNARDKGVKITYAFNMGEVTRSYRDAHPELPLVPNLGYDANIIQPDSPQAKEVTKRYMEEVFKLYGTDHIYESTPFAESLGASSPEESFKLKVTAAKTLCSFLKDIDPEYMWCTDSWDMLTYPSVWTIDRIKKYSEIFRNEMLMFDISAERSTPFWKSTDCWQGTDWGFCVLHSYQGDDHLHGNMADLVNRIHDAVNSPRSSKMIGFYTKPESNGHNIMYYQLTSELSWNPAQIDVDSFVKKYARTRYDAGSYKNMVECLKKVVEAVYTGAMTDMYYQRIGIHYTDYCSVPFEDYHSNWRPDFAGFSRSVPLMEQAVEIALRAAANERGNKLFENDLVDFTKTMLGLKSNYYILEAYSAFKKGDKAGFEAACANVGKCLDGIEKILSTRPDYSLAKMINDVMKVPGTNPYLPKMIRKGCMNEMYPNDEVYEQLVLMYRPKVEAYLGEMRNRLSQGVNTITYSDARQKFDELDNRWWQNDAIVPADRAFKGATIEAIESVYRVVPLGQIKSMDSSVELKEGQTLTCMPGEGKDVEAVSCEDGAIKKSEADGKACWIVGDPAQHLYFCIDPEDACNCTEPMAVSVTYYDSGEGSFTLQYDSHGSAYKQAGEVALTGTNTWKTVDFELMDAKFNKSQNGGSDFRIHSAHRLCVSAVSVRSLKKTVLPTADVLERSK